MDDIRNFQIFAQLILISFGYWSGYLSKSPLDFFTIIFSSLIFQYLLIDRKKLGFNWKSPVITSLSLILLLKSVTVFLWPLMSFLCIGSKRLTIKGKHFLNPSLFGILIGVTILKNYIWMTPGAWGEAALLLLTFLLIGSYLLFNVSSKSTILSFLGTYFSLLILRQIYLGDPLALYTHQVSNISFILFSFFMISDPKTVPRYAFAQCLFGGITALFCYYFKFFHFEPYFLYYGLACSAFFLPILRNYQFNARRYHYV